jgi:hypothetical protein
MISPSIYLSLASYRDPELIPTVASALATALHPDRLVFGLGWQHTPDETLPADWHKDEHFRIIDVPHDKTRGCCWMRSELMKRWTGEDFFLQLDSHHRFADHWDAQLIQIYDDLLGIGVKKPLLTSYISSYDPRNDPAGRHPTPFSHHFDRLIPEGSYFTRPADMPSWQQRTYPERNRFFSAHFAFSRGQFCEDVPYDPELWFHGEEPSMALRAYTHGYDSYAIHRPLVWHEYTRRGRPHVWDQGEPVSQVYGKWNELSHQRVKWLLGTDGAEGDLGKYGLGTERTREDYERFAGIRFRDRTVQQWTLDHHPPPNPDPDAPYLRFTAHFCDLHYSLEELADFDFVAVSFMNKDGVEVFRQDAFGDEFNKWKADIAEDKYIKCFRQFVADPNNPPVKWMVRPHSRTKGWCPVAEGVSP